MKNSNALIITGSVYPNSAQGIRYKKLYQQLSGSYNLLHLTFDISIFQLDKAENIGVFHITQDKKSKLKSFFWQIIKKIGNVLTFPDSMVLFLPMYKRKLKRLFFERKFDLIIIGVTPFSLLELGDYIKTLQPTTSLIADFSDPFSGNAFLQSYSDKYKNKCLYFERKHMLHFNKIICLNSKIKDYYVANIGLKEDDVIVIEQGINELFTKPIKCAAFTIPLKLVYAGGFYKEFRDPKNLYDVINTHSDKIELHVFGSIKKRFQGYSFKGVYYYGVVPEERVFMEYINANIIVLMDNSWGIQVPGKTIECLSIKRPVLFIYENENSPTLKYIKDAKGIVSCKNTCTEIKNAIDFLFFNYSSLASEFNYNPYTWKNLFKKFSSSI